MERKEGRFGGSEGEGVRKIEEMMELRNERKKLFHELCLWGRRGEL